MNMIKMNKAEIYLIFLLLLQTWKGEAGPSGNRIIGPQQTPKNEFPWLVKIELRSIDGFSIPHCGGTLLNTRVVLSAAHCTFFPKSNVAIPFDMMTVYLGEHDTTIPDGEQAVGITHYLIHPYYNPNNADNDFAIIYLAREIQFSDTINQACLPQPFTAYDNTAVVAAGWGAEKNNGMGTTRPKHVDLTTMSNQVCNSKITGQPLFGWQWVQVVGGVTENMICATGMRKGICDGDSGGPLMVKGDENIVIGVSSWGPADPGCNMHGESPSVFARVTSQLNWIKELAKDTC